MKSNMYLAILLLFSLLKLIVLVLIVNSIINHIKRNRKSTGSDILTITIGILFFCLLIYSMRYRLSSDFRSADMVWIKGIAKSAHFAANALTSASLYDLEGYTGEVLRWVESKDGFLSFPYIYLGCLLTIAPLSTAAWIASLLAKVVKGASTSASTLNKSNIIFLKTSNKSISIATSLNKRLKNKNYLFCRVADNAYELERTIKRYLKRYTVLDCSEDELTILGKDNYYVLEVNDRNEFTKYIEEEYRFPDNIKGFLVISNHEIEEIEAYYGKLGNNKYKPKLYSYCLLDILVSELKKNYSHQTRQDTIIVTNGKIAEYLEEHFLSELKDETIWFFELGGTKEDTENENHHFQPVTANNIDTKLEEKIDSISKGTIILCLDKDNMQYYKTCSDIIREKEHPNQIEFIIYNNDKQNSTKNEKNKETQYKKSFISNEDLCDIITNDFISKCNE